MSQAMTRPAAAVAKKKGRPASMRFADPETYVDKLRRIGCGIAEEERTMQRMRTEAREAARGDGPASAKRARVGTGGDNSFFFREAHYLAKKYGGRLFAQNAGAQLLPQRAQRRVLGHTVDLDMANAMTVILAELVDKLQLVDASTFRNEYATLQNLAANRDGLISSELHEGAAIGKQVLLVTLQGGAAPDHLQTTALVKQVTRVARWLRWLACSVLEEVYEQRAVAGKAWPESSCLSILWQIVESYLVQRWIEWIPEMGAPRHLSLHFDGLRVDRSFCESISGSVPSFIERSQNEIFSRTTFKVKLVEKQHLSLLDHVRSGATPTDDRLSVDPSLMREGNCILLALFHLRDAIPAAAAVAWSASSLAADAARDIRCRTYREVFEIGHVPFRATFGYHSHAGATAVLHCEADGRPHALPVRVSADGAETVVYDGDVARRFPSGRFVDMIHRSVDRKLIVTFHVGQALARLRSSPGDAVLPPAALSDLADLAAGASSELSSGETRARAEMLECLRLEVREYTETLSCRLLHACRQRLRAKGPSSGHRCALCPEGIYSSWQQLLDHVRTDHVWGNYFSPCGRKFLNLVYAVFDSDRFAERRPQQLLRRAARMLRDMLATDSTRLRRRLDRSIVLLLTGKGPRYVQRADVSLREDVLRVGQFYIDRHFAAIVLQQALLQNGRVRPLIDAVTFELLQRGCATTGLLPRRLTAWLSITEAVADNELIKQMRDAKLALCLAGGDYRHLTMDATFRLLRRVRGQAAFNQPATARSMAVIPEAEAKRRLLTVMGVASTPLGVYAVRDEAADSLADVLVREWSMEQRAAVLSITVDNPFARLVERLSEIMPNLRLVCLDPPHLSFKYEQHHGDRRTAGSRVLRKMMGKFWQYDPYVSPSHWGPIFRGTSMDMPLSSTEQFYADQILRGDMNPVHAERIVEDMQCHRPWMSVCDFIQSMAAFVVVHRNELQSHAPVARMTRERGTRRPSLRRTLHYASTPPAVHFLFNNLRLLSMIDVKEQALIATGTTANEALRHFRDPGSEIDPRIAETTADTRSPHHGRCWGEDEASRGEEGVTVSVVRLTLSLRRE